MPALKTPFRLSATLMLVFLTGILLSAQIAGAQKKRVRKAVTAASEAAHIVLAENQMSVTVFCSPPLLLSIDQYGGQQRDFILEFAPRPARYVKVKAHTIGNTPSWRRASREYAGG